MLGYPGNPGNIEIRPKAVRRPVPKKRAQPIPDKPTLRKLTPDQNGIHVESVPSNLNLIRLQKEYKKIFPEKIAHNIDTIRKFVLEDIIALGVSLPSGFEEAFEVGRLALGELDEQETAQLEHRAEQILNDIIQIRLVSFLANLSNLNSQETNLLNAMQLLRNGGVANNPSQQNVLQQIVSQLLKVSSMPRQAESGELPLPQIQPVQEHRKRKRDR